MVKAQKGVGKVGILGILRRRDDLKHLHVIYQTALAIFCLVR